ncbi:MFS transporter [Jatrophihabitans sp. DSM 45814]
MGTDWEAGGASPDGFSQPTYHHIQPPGGQQPPEQLDPGKRALAGRESNEHDPREPRAASARPAGTGDVTVTRAVMARSRYLSKLVAHKVISASQADGARESGLTALIWNQVMSYGADAMVTVALAGTVFFSAPSDAQRGNVLLYLLITMAPFALVAPIIGPGLDRIQHGRRWLMAGTAIGRALLAIVMAQNFTDLYVLFPAALGSLVLSKAYAVIRSSAAPRLVPSNLTLVEANARLSIFGLAAALLGGGIVGVTIKVTGSYPLGLWITAVAFAATAFYSFRLPKIVDTLPEDAVHVEKRARSAAKEPPAARLFSVQRLLAWSRRGFTQPVILALQGESTLRWLSGFITLFLAFYIEATSHGWEAVASLGAMGGATGVGNFLGTGIGTRLKMARPDLIILMCNALAAVACLVTAVFFSLPMAIVAALCSAISNALAKLSLDAVIQRDVAESLRSSAFGRSETFLQLSWVLGATIAILLPSTNGQLGFGVAAGLTVGVALFMALRERAVRARGHTQPVRPEREAHPGNLGA